MKKILLTLAMLSCYNGLVNSQTLAPDCDTCHIKLFEYKEPLEGLNKLLLKNCEWFLSTNVDMVYVNFSDSSIIEYLSDQNDFGKEGYFLDILHVVKIQEKKGLFEIKAHVSVQPNPCYFELLIIEELGGLKIKSLRYTHTEI